MIPVPPRVSRRRSFLGTGVLSGPKNRLGALLAIVLRRTQRVKGYMVESKTALDLLAARSPEAAELWRHNAPHFFEPGRAFVFTGDSCAEIP